MKDHAPVSVIIPCYRCKDTIERALSSVLAQTRPVAEIILVDDASGDGTLTALHALRNKYQHHPISVLECEQNGGPGGARNAGWEVATQPWIALLDADDGWHPQKIEIQFGWLEHQHNVALCAHDSVLWGEDSELEHARFSEPFRIKPAELLIRNPIPTRSVVMRRDIPFRFGGKDVTEDYLMWLELALSGYPCWKMPVTLVYSYRPEFSSGGYSGALWTHEKRELRCFLKLYSQGLLTWFQWFGISTFSLIKYLRRCLIIGKTRFTKG